MELKSFYKLQKELDDSIMNGLEVDREKLLDNKYLALKVEIAEFHNEIQHFKYWKRHNEPKGNVLEEGIDVVHFLLSIAILRNWDQFVTHIARTHKEKSLLDYSLDLEQNQMTCSGDYIQAFRTLLAMFHLMGYTEQDVEDAYMQKNLINHERQATGY